MGKEKPKINKNKIFKGIYSEGKQIRVWVNSETHKNLTKESEIIGLTLNEYVGLKLIALSGKKLSFFN